MVTTLKEQYTACCQAYADLLLKLMDRTWSDACWLRGVVGGTLAIAGQYSFPMSSIAYIIDNDMTVEEVAEWHDYNSRAVLTDMFQVDIDSWHNGAEHASADDMELLISLRQEMTDAIDREGDMSPEYGNAKRKFDIARERILNAMHIYRSEML